MNTDNSTLDFRFKFSGRARRKTYWSTSYVLAIPIIIIYVTVAIILKEGWNATEYCDKDEFEGLVYLISFPFALPFLIIQLGLEARRLHDIGISAKWLLFNILLFIPIIGNLTTIVFLILYCKDSKKETNKWGPSPKYGDGTENEKGESPAEPPAEQEQELPPLEEESAKEHEDDSGIAEALPEEKQEAEASSPEDKAPSEEQTQPSGWSIAAVALSVISMVFTFILIFSYQNLNDKISQQNIQLLAREHKLESAFTQKIDALEEQLRQMQQENERKQTELTQQMERAEGRLTERIEEKEEVPEQISRSAPASPATQPETPDSSIETPEPPSDQNQLLYNAACTNDLAGCERALSAGADVNAALYIIKWTPLHIAAFHGNAESVRWLLAHGADAKAQDVDGNTPRMLATQKGHVAVGELLERAESTHTLSE